MREPLWMHSIEFTRAAKADEVEWHADTGPTIGGREVRISNFMPDSGRFDKPTEAAERYWRRRFGQEAA